MGRKTKWFLIGIGFVVRSLYRNRRQIIARALKLSPAQHDVAVKRDLKVPMHDGAILHTDHYFPKSRGTFPTILIRTPYGRGLEAMPYGLLSLFIGQRFAERGYNVIIQGVRGRFDQNGEFEPFLHEAADGKATLDWLEQQPWFDGQLGMWGQSYLGYTQWAIADDPRVKAMLPSITAARLNAAILQDGVISLDTILRWTMLVEAMDNRGKYSTLEALRRMAPDTQNKILEPVFQHLPLNETDTMLIGQTADHWQHLLSMPDADDQYWIDTDQSPNVAKTSAAVHLVSGWRDFVLRELLADYCALKDAGHTPHLTIGPWFHVDFGNLFASLREGVNWFDAHLKGKRGELRGKPVKYFVMGADEWRDADHWPVPARETRYFLHTERGLSTEQPTADSAPDHYRYDSADPTPSLSGALLSPDAAPADNRPLEARDDVLTYTTPPLTGDLEIVGPVRLELYVDSSLEHTDFFGRLCDVHPDGQSINICDGIIRISPESAQPRSNGSRCVEIDMWATANLFKRGHCIRLQVSSGAHPRWNRNLGTGEPASTCMEMCVAEQTIFHDAAHPSALVLPVTQG